MAATLQKLDFIHVSPFRPEDLDALLVIEEEVHASPWSRASYEDIICLDSIFIWVARIQNELVGYMLFQKAEEEIELHTIGVTGRYQRQGIGKRLMEKLMTEAKTFGTEGISLQVRVSNTPAQKLYLSFGFVNVGLRKKYYQDNREDALVMRKKLTSHEGLNFV